MNYPLKMIWMLIQVILFSERLVFLSYNDGYGRYPYSEALNIEEHRYPQYDEQKDVFKGILEDLALADEYFAKSKQAFSGDPFYQGDPKKWRKATNVLRLKVLMSLSKRQTIHRSCK